MSSSLFNADLPIAAALPELQRALAASDRVLLEAPPGAGKSTGLPLWILGQLDATPERRILLLQPRRLAADNVARFLARQCGEALGQRVGLRTRYDQQVSAQTVIEVITEGIFLRRIQADPTLAGIGWVLFDEFHERSWQADLGLAFALESQRDWRDQPLKLLVMSATLPATALQQALDAPLVRSEGRSYPVEVSYSPPGRRELLDQAADEVLAAVAAGSRKVLVFLAGWGPMQQLMRRLEGRVDADIHLLHSQVPPAQQQLALAPVGERPAVVLSTNIAETSVTIDGVDTVLDSGEVRRAQFDPRRGMDRLETGWISQASATQRAGRAGRLGPGRCVRLWSSEQQGRLLPHDPAEIEQVDLAPLALELALWGSGDALWLPQAPPSARLAQARELLHELGALDANDHITAGGRRLAGLGVHPRLGRLILAGAETGHLRAACQLAALLSEGDFLRSGTDLDLRLALLRGGQSRADVSHGVLQRVKQLATQLQQRVGGAAGSDAHAGELLLAAFPDRVARRRPGGNGRYLAVDGFEVVIDATDPLAASEWLVIAEHDGDRRGARVRLAAAVAFADIEEQLAGRIVNVDEVVWDGEREVLTGRRVRRLGAIELAVAAQPVGETESAAFWLAQVRERGLGWLRWSDGVDEWLGRLRWLREQSGGEASDWPDLSDAALLSSLDDWLLPWLAGVRRLDQLRALDFRSLLLGRLDYSLQQRAEREAPTRLQLPSGCSHAIRYQPGEPPRLAARVQEFYGLDVHPIVGRNEPLLLELLSPAQRPVQLTRDLPGFWRSSYGEVKKEMRGRYPRHFWPDDPWQAQATTRTKRGMANPS